MIDGVHFKTIDIDRHFSDCLAFREIAYLASYGRLKGFSEHYGEGYRSRLTQKIDSFPLGNCHIWYQDRIVGQTESKEVDEPTVGYINLLSVVPDLQNRGLGRLMVDHLRVQFSLLGKTKLQLSVSKSNHPAQVFYQKTGWATVGERADKPYMLILERRIDGH